MIPLLMPIVRAPSYVLWLSYMVFCSCCAMIIHSNHFYSIDGDYDNGWNLEDVEVIKLINRWIPNSHSAPTEWSHGISDYLSVRSSEQIYTCPLGLLNRYTSHGIVFQTGICTLSFSILLWLGHSLSELKRFPWSFDCEGMCCVYLGGGLTI